MQRRSGFLIFTLMFLLTYFSCGRNRNADPVSPYSTREAQKLLSFLHEISGYYTLSGMHNYIQTGSKYTDTIKKISGKTPLVWGSDFSFCYKGDHPGRFQHCGPLNLTPPGDSVEFTGLDAETARIKMIQKAIEMHRKGHIITLMWHCCFPDQGDCCQGENIWAMENRPDPETWDRMLTVGTELNTLWKKQLDKIAVHLKVLQEAGVPVLWRPYHEMNGVWFWWCDHPGDDGFKRLWISMFKYFTEEHKLRNLIWVWNTNAPRDIPGDEAFDYELFYPGDQYVDVLAADVYRRDYKQSHHDDLKNLSDKPIALGEVGELPDHEILMNQPGWIWFMPWGYHSLKWNNPEEIFSLYNLDKVISLEDITRDEDGGYSIIKNEVNQ